MENGKNGKPYTPEQEDQIHSVLMQLVTGLSAERIAEIAGECTITEAFKKEIFIPYYKYPNKILRATALLNFISQTGLEMGLPSVIRMLKEINTLEDMGPLIGPHITMGRLLSPSMLARILLSPEILSYTLRNDVSYVMIKNGTVTAYGKDGLPIVPNNEKPNKPNGEPNDTSGKNTPNGNASGDVPRPITGVIPDDDDDDIPG